MKGYRAVTALTAVNLAALLFVATRGGWAAVETPPTVLRAEAIELVDKLGKVRARLNVEQNGEAVFRMLDAKGEVRVKLGASEDGSGLLLANQATEPGVHILANGNGSSLALKNVDGKQRIIRATDNE